MKKPLAILSLFSSMVVALTCGKWSDDRESFSRQYVEKACEKIDPCTYVMNKTDTLRLGTDGKYHRKVTRKTITDFISIEN